MTRNLEKVWIECNACKHEDPCLIFMPKKVRKVIPSNYCFLAELITSKKKTGRWNRPKWSKQELTV